MRLLDPASKEALRASYLAYRQKHQEFACEQNLVSLKQGPLGLSLVKEMALECDLFRPIADLSHRKYTGFMIVRAKAALRRLARPFMQILLARQLRMNELSVSLAYALASLEGEVAHLRKALLEAQNRETLEGKPPCKPPFKTQ